MYPQQDRQLAEQLSSELKEARSKAADLTRGLSAAIQERDDLRHLLNTKEQRAQAAEAAAAAAQLQRDQVGGLYERFIKQIVCLPGGGRGGHKGQLAFLAEIGQGGGGETDM